MTEEKTELLQVKYDTLFHDLFNENEMQTLEWVVMQVLDCKYEDIKGRVEVKNIRKPKVSKNEKEKYVDLIVNFKEERLIFELNFNFKGNYTRNLMYALNELLGFFDKDDETYYKRIARVILVNLNWFYKGNDFNLPSKEVYELPYPNYKKQGYILKVINVNLDSFNKLCYNQVDECDKFYKLLTVKNKEDFTNLVGNEKMLKSYSNKLMDLSKSCEYKEKLMNERIERNLAKQEGYFEGVDDGIQEGIEQGIKKGNLETKQEIVLNMYKENFSLDIISKATKLSLDKINEIIENQ